MMQQLSSVDGLLRLGTAPATVLQQRSEPSQVSLHSLLLPRVSSACPKPSAYALAHVYWPQTPWMRQTLSMRMCFQVRRRRGERTGQDGLRQGIDERDFYQSTEARNVPEPVYLHKGLHGRDGDEVEERQRQEGRPYQGCAQVVLPHSPPVPPCTQLVTSPSLLHHSMLFMRQPEST